MATYIDEDLLIEKMSRLRGCSCSYSDGIIDEIEDIMSDISTADVVEREKIDKAIKIATDSISVCFKLGLNERAFGMQEILQIFTRIQEGKDEESID